MYLLGIVCCTLLCGCAGGAKTQSDDDERGDLLPYFSLSDSTSVYFAPSNLQYNFRTHTGRFTAHTYDRLDPDSATAGWTDGLAWSAENQPITTQAAYADWATIAPEDEFGTEWRTPSREEWEYLIQGRDSDLCTRATVDGTAGLLLLPDQFEKSQDIALTPSATDYTTNTYTLREWEKLDEAGAVFLPATACASGCPTGTYWSSTAAKDGQSVLFFFSADSCTTVEAPATEAHYVRLVRDL